MAASPPRPEGRGSAACCSGRRCVFPAPARERGGNKRPSPGSEAANSPLKPRAPRRPAEPRAALAHSRAPPGSAAAARAPGLPGLPLPPDAGATSLKAARRSSGGPGREGAGPCAGRSGIPERRNIRLRGAGAGDPHQLPRLWLGAGGDAPRSPRPLLRWLDLARVLKAGPAAPGRPGAEFRCRLRSGGGGSLPPLPSAPPPLRGSHRNEKASGP